MLKVADKERDTNLGGRKEIFGKGDLFQSELWAIKKKS